MTESSGRVLNHHTQASVMEFRTIGFWGVSSRASLYFLRVSWSWSFDTVSGMQAKELHIHLRLHGGLRVNIRRAKLNHLLVGTENITGGQQAISVQFPTFTI